MIVNTIVSFPYLQTLEDLREQQQQQNQQMLAFLRQQRQQTSLHPPSTGSGTFASKPSLHSDGQRTADQIAEQLHSIYAQFLEAFEMQYTTAMMKQSMGGGVSDQSAAEDAAWELAELASMRSSSL